MDHAHQHRTKRRENTSGSEDTIHARACSEPGSEQRRTGGCSCNSPSLPLSSPPVLLADRDAVSSARHGRLLDNLMYLVLSINEKRDHIPVKNLPAPLYFSF